MNDKQAQQRSEHGAEMLDRLLHAKRVKMKHTITSAHFGVTLHEGMIYDLHHTTVSGESDRIQIVVSLLVTMMVGSKDVEFLG